MGVSLLADVDKRVADGNGVVAGVNANHTNVLVGGSGDVLHRVGGHLGPVGRGDSGTGGDGLETGDGGGGVIVCPQRISLLSLLQGS